MNENLQTPNLAFYLPYGELLRTFLDQGFITEKDLRDLLRKRGIFLDTYTKEKAIPHLALATVTPAEFDVLLGLQRAKLESTKTVSETVEWSSSKNVIDALPDQIDVSKIFGQSLSAKVINLSPPQIIDNNPNHVRYELEVEKSNLHESWHVDKTPHLGSIEIQKTGEGDHAVIEITSTIPETKVAGKKIVKDLQEKLTISGDIPPKAKRKKLQFSSFENAERVKFFLSLTEDISTEISFSAMTDSSIFADTSKDLPPVIKNYFEKVNRVHLEGDELEHSMFLTDKSYHPFIQISRMVVLYEFDYHGGKGSCTVEYKFEGYPKMKRDHDFMTNPTKFVWDQMRTSNKVVARKYIEAAIREFVRRKSHPHFTVVAEDVPESKAVLAAPPIGRKPPPRIDRSTLVRAERD